MLYNVRQTSPPVDLSAIAHLVTIKRPTNLMSAPTPDPIMSVSGSDLSGDDVEQLIYDIAEHAQDNDYNQLYQSLVDKELFVPVEEDSFTPDVRPINSSEMSQAGDDSAMQIRYAEGPRGEAMVPLATKTSSPTVAGAHVGVYWLNALEIVLKTEEVAGLLLHGENSWICFYKPQIEHILKTYSETAKN